jgi:hypothetical protein
MKPRRGRSSIGCAEPAMAREHLLAPEIANRQLEELRIRREGDDPVVDAYFADPRGDRLHLCFIGVTELRVSRIKLGASGYQLLDLRELERRDRTVQLVPPKSGGIAFFARLVMAVD